jgi:hypothetical protein
MRRRFAFATAIVCAVGIMLTIPFSGMLSSTAVVAQQQQQINSNTSSSQDTTSPNPPILIAEILLGTTIGYPHRF